MLDNLLKYWHRMEFFAPCWPVREKEFINLSEKPAPWPEPPEQESLPSYDIYLLYEIYYL
jgi:hypothetical protein